MLREEAVECACTHMPCHAGANAATTGMMETVARVCWWHTADFVSFFRQLPSGSRSCVAQRAMDPCCHSPATASMNQTEHPHAPDCRRRGVPGAYRNSFNCRILCRAPRCLAPGPRGIKYSFTCVHGGRHSKRCLLCMTFPCSTRL